MTVTNRAAHSALISRDSEGWIVSVDDIPGAEGFATTIEAAKVAARHAVSACLQVDESAVALDYRVEVGGDLQVLVDSYIAAKLAAAEAAGWAARARAAASAGLKAAGIPVQDADEVLGLSFQPYVAFAPLAAR
jgi:predicted RNase H-like HicB family nuclease